METQIILKTNVTATLRNLPIGESVHLPLDRHPVSGIKTAIKRLRREGLNYSLDYRGKNYSTITRL